MGPYSERPWNDGIHYLQGSAQWITSSLKQLVEVEVYGRHMIHRNS